MIGRQAAAQRHQQAWQHLQGARAQAANSNPDPCCSISWDRAILRAEQKNSGAAGIRTNPGCLPQGEAQHSSTLKHRSNMLITIHPRWRRCAWPALALVAASLTLAASADSPQAAFIAENDAAMTKMMAGMGVKPTGDIDRDFAAMMIPHHQGAIDMALAELRYGSNEQLRRIAQEIIVEQQQEIAAMHMALG